MTALSGIEKIKWGSEDLVAVIAYGGIRYQFVGFGIGYTTRQGTATGFLSITDRASHCPSHKIRIRRPSYDQYYPVNPESPENYVISKFC